MEDNEYLADRINATYDMLRVALKQSNEEQLFMEVVRTMNFIKAFMYVSGYRYSEQGFTKGKK